MDLAFLSQLPSIAVGNHFRPGPVGEASNLQQLMRSPLLLAIINRERRLVWTGLSETEFGRTPSLGQTLENLVRPSCAADFKADVEEAFVSQQSLYCEHRGCGELNQEVWYGARIVPLPTSQGDEHRALVICADVTAGRGASRASRGSEERFRKVAEASPDIILLVNSELTIEYLNRDPGSEATQPVSIGAPFLQLLDEKDRPRVRRAIEKTFTTKRPTQYSATTVGGRILQGRVRHLGSEDGHEQALIFATDVTEQKVAEAEHERLGEQLRHSQKMETIGQLAGGVAHDFNNLLLTVQGQLHFARAALAEGRDPSEELEPIGNALAHASDLTQRLLAIGRKQRHSPKPISLCDFVTTTAGLLRRVIPESIRIDCALKARDAVIHADAPQLEQVLMNLCVNARDSIGDGTGTITITVDREPFPDGMAVGEMESRYVCLSVADTGRGMDVAMLARIFEPFYSTKPRGKGTGLGLAMVHGIVTRHGGYVDVASQPGTGSRFTLFLPELNEDQRRVSQPSATTVPPGSGQLILLAEDEPTVRKIVKRILNGAGYRVLIAADGQEAVDLLLKHRDEVCAAMLDAVMPNLCGRDAYDQMRIIRPGLPVLFSSGYAADSLPQSYLEAKGVQLLAKPYTPAMLLSALQDLLHAASLDREVARDEQPSSARA